MQDLRPLLALVGDQDPQIRKYALGQLELLGDAVEDEDVLEGLRLATRDPDPMVSHQAARSLAVILHRAFGSGGRRDGGLRRGGAAAGRDGAAGLRAVGLGRLQPVLDLLHRAVAGEDLALAKRAVISLAKVGAPASLPVLEEALGHPSLGEIAAVALPQLTTEDALRPLLRAASKGQGTLKAHAALALGKFPVEEARDCLVALVGDKNPVVRANVATALGEMGPLDGVLGALGRLTRDGEVWVVIYAVRSLAGFADDMAFDLLCTTCAEASDDRVRATCVAALGSRGDIRAERVLIEYLRAPDDRVRANTVDALSLLGLPADRLTALLAPLASDSSPRVLANVAVALHPVDPGPSMRIVHGLLGSDDSWTRASGIYCLGELRTAESLALLARVLVAAGTDEDALTRVLRALERRRGETVPEELLAQLSHPSVPTRARLCRALGRMRGEGLGAKLVARYRVETEPTVRSALLFALGEQGDQISLDCLTTALVDPEPRVVADAVEVLGGLNDLQVLSLLRPLTTHPANRVRANAIVALWNSGETDVVDDLLVMLGSLEVGSARSGFYAAGEMGRILRHLGDAGAPAGLVAALERLRASGARGDDLSDAAVAATSSSRETLPGAEDLETAVERYIREGAVPALALLDRFGPGHALAVEVAFLTYRFQAEGGDPTEAFRTLESIGELGGAFVTPVLDLAHGYTRLKLEDKALVCFLEAFRRYQTILGEVLESGALAVHGEHLAEARQLCRYLMKGPAFGPDIHLLTGREYLAVGDFERAFPHLFRAHLSSPQDAVVSMDVAYAACRIGRMALGRRLCEEVFHLCRETPTSPLLAKARKMFELIRARTGA